MDSLPSSSSSDSPIIEQVMAELFAKIVHIVLESRSPFISGRKYNAVPSCSTSPSSASPNFLTRGEWFNLTTKDCSTSQENFDLRRQSNLEPLVVDVIFNHRKEVKNSCCNSPAGISVRNLSSGRDEFGGLNRNEKIVERWIVQYESQSISQPGRDSSSQGRKEGSRGAYQSSEFQVMYRKVYRRICVLLRSLYSAVRLLPAYKLFKNLNRSGQTHKFSLSYRISSFAEPFSREEDAEMSLLDFGPLDFFFRKFSLSVAYLKELKDVNSEPPVRISSEFITDYIGSPLADPLKRFPSLPIAGSAPSFATLSHQHNWCNDHGETPFLCPTPHTYSDSRALYHNSNPNLQPHCHLPENFESSCSISGVSSTSHTKQNDERWPSLPLSSSSSALTTTIHLYGALSCTASAPISIPLFRHKEIDGGKNQILSASFCSKSNRQGCPCQVDKVGTQVSTTSTTQTFSPENKLQLKKESLRLMEFQTDMVLQKMTSTGKDSGGHITGSITPLYAPSHLQSRGSSRLSFLDEFDDSDFICHFAEDYKSKSSCWAKSNNGKDHAGENPSTGGLMITKRSPDAAVGALVWTLRNAPPLRLDKSNKFRSLQVFKDNGSSLKSHMEKMASNEKADLLKVDSTWCLDITTSELCKPKTAADAFKELMTYKGIRELILKKSGPRLLDVEYIAKSNIKDLSEVK